MRLYFLIIVGLLFVCQGASAQNAALHGKVETKDGQPIKYISVVIVNTGQGAVTKEDGTFEIGNIKPGDYSVQVSFNGLKSETKTARLTAGSNVELNFTIDENYKEIAPVIIEAARIMNKAATTANKMPVSNLESPQIVNNISDVVLRKQNAMTLEDAMKNAPGVTKLWDATSRPDGGSIFVSRGFQTVTKARNGLPNTVNTNVDMANLDRIEVIKGPSATLFGSVIGSYGGVINRVTKKPHFYNDGMIDVSYGSYNFFRAAVDANAVLVKDKLAGRINVAGYNQDSWQDYGFQKSLLIAPSFVYKPNSRLTVNLDGEFNSSKGNSNGGNFLFILNPTYINSSLSPAIAGAMQQQGASAEMINAVLSQIPATFEQAYGTNKVKDLRLDYNRSFLNNDVYPQTSQNTVFADATYRISKSWTSQTAITYGGGNNKGYSAYQYLIPNYLYSFLTTLTPGTAGADSLARMVWNPVGTNRTFNFQQNFVSDYHFGSLRARTVVGFDGVKYKSNVTYNRFSGVLFNVFPFPDVFDVVDVAGNSPAMGNFTKENVLAAFANRPNTQLPYNQESTILSGYANSILNISSFAIASLGVRVDNFKNDILKNTQTKWSPKFGLILMPVKDRLSVFGNYQNSFTNKFGTDRYGNAFEPEEANQKEVGVKYLSVNNKISGSISYYHILAKNIIRQDIVDPMFNVQDGEQRSKGVEVDITVNPVKGWTLLAGYAYNDSKMVKADSDVQGLRPVGSGPYNTYNFWTNYTFTDNVLDGLSLGVSVNHAGETFAFNLNPDGALIMPKYTILGAHINYDTRSFRFAVKCNNLTDQKYWMGWNSIIPQMPRQLIGTISYKF